MPEETEVQDPETQEATGMPDDKEPEATPEEREKEGPTSEADEQEKPEAKKPYTAEELEEIIASDGQVDSERLTPEGKLLQKSFQRGYGKKFESLAEERRKLQQQESERPEVTRGPKDPKEEYFEQYMANPVNTVREINAEIQTVKARVRTLTANGEFEKANAEEEKATYLENLREEFAVRRQSAREERERVAGFEQEVLKAIPDIDSKVDLLTAFAKEELGYTDNELYQMTNPASGISVSVAVKNISIIDRLYRQANAAKTVSKKVKKSTPSPLERGGVGSGGGPSTSKVSPEKMNMKEFVQWRATPQKTST